MPIERHATERDVTARARRRGPVRPRGATSVEFALLLPLFCFFFYLGVEMARATFLINTVYAVTERAARLAAVTDFADPAAMQRVRQRAVFRDGPGALMLGGDISDAYVKIDYLSLGAGGARAPLSQLPPCPKINQVNCLDDPHGAACIRFVRARLCLPGGDGDCAAVPYQPLLPLLAGLFGDGAAAVGMGSATTLLPAASLGYRPGAASPGCP